MRKTTVVRSRYSWLLLLLIAAVVLPLVVSAYVTQIGITTITYAMLGLSFALGMRVGLPRLDIAVWWGVGGYATALLMKAGVSFWLTLPAAGCIAVALGFVIYSLALPRGMIAFFMFCMVVSMAFSQLFGSLSFLGGWGGITGIPKVTLFSFTFNTETSLYYLGLLFLLVTMLVYSMLYRSRIGRAWDAITSSPRLAGSIGVNVVRYRMASVLIGNFFIALAGSYFVVEYGAAIPTVFSFVAGVYAIVYLFIGGVGFSIAGPILGAIVATFIPEYFQFAQQWRSVVVSAVVIFILVVFPEGLLGLVSYRIWPWLRMRFGPRNSPVAAGAGGDSVVPAGLGGTTKGGE